MNPPKVLHYIRNTTKQCQVCMNGKVNFYCTYLFFLPYLKSDVDTRWVRKDLKIASSVQSFAIQGQKENGSEGSQQTESQIQYTVHHPIRDILPKEVPLDKQALVALRIRLFTCKTRRCAPPPPHAHLYVYNCLPVRFMIYVQKKIPEKSLN